MARAPTLRSATPRSTNSEAIGQIRASIVRLRRSKRFVWRRESGSLANEIDAIGAAIVEQILPNEPRNAAILLETLVRSADSVFQHVDDSDGLVGTAYRESVRYWGRAWTETTDRQPIALAARVLTECQGNDFGIKDQLIAAFASALGSEGLAEVRKRLEAILATAPIGDEANDARSRAGHLLGEVADALGDVDGYIAAMRAIGWLEIDALGIARRLSGAGRPEEALQALDQIRSHVGNEHRAADLKITLLEELSRPDDAQALRYAIFERRLSPTHFLEYRERFQSDAKLITSRAIEHANASRQTLEALSFLIAIDEYAEAEHFIVRRGADIDGDSYETLRRVAKELTAAHPLGALLLHRAMAMAVLSRANSTNYAYAVKDVRAAEKLALRVTDWRRVLGHEAFVEELRRLHRLKSAFWKRFEVASPPTQGRK